MRRPSLHDPYKEAKYSHESNREALIYHLRDRFQTYEFLLEAVLVDPFLILCDVYKIVASNWVVINENINRELATIEYVLEKELPGSQDLEMYLRDLYIHRRRVTRYHELVSEAKGQCSRRGQPNWSGLSPSHLTVKQAEDLEGYSVYLLTKAHGTGQRIEKNINLLTALVAIGEGKQSLDENHGIIQLTVLATLFLPFSTIAPVLSLQGMFAPGAVGFWVYWVVAILLTMFIVSLFAFYNNFARPTFH